MVSYVQNQGFTKTIIHDNKHNLLNEINWKSNYDGKIAKINLEINNNGKNEFVSLQLNNNELKQLFGIQSVEMPIEKRLINDFFSKPIALEGALIKRRKTRQNKKKRRKQTKRILY